MGLLCHKFGNYVIQHLLEFGSVLQKHRVACTIHQDTAGFSRQQFGSKVVEEALNRCADEDKRAIAGDLLSDPTELTSLAESQFGRFVVIALAKTSDNNSKQVKSHLLSTCVQLQVSKYGKDVWDSLELASAAA